MAGKIIYKDIGELEQKQVLQGNEKLPVSSDEYITPEQIVEGVRQQASNIAEQVARKYEKPSDGIPSSDMSSGVQQSLGKANSAYQKPGTGIPKIDMASSVQMSLNMADSAYQKPNNGIPKTDLAGGVKASLDKADSSVQPADLTPITEVIPAQASSENQLADKEFVNSSIATNTATFRGTFNSVEALNAYAGEKDNNDYAFVLGADSAGNTSYSRYKYNGTAWVFEYTLNNSSFTSAQWAAINSGISSEELADILNDVASKEDAIPDLTTIRSGAAAGATAYQKPGTGIPASDLASAVQTSLGKADSAYQKPSGGIPKTDMAGGVQDSLDLADTALQWTPSGEINPEITPAEYATREEMEELDQEVNGETLYSDTHTYNGAGNWTMLNPLVGGDKIWVKLTTTAQIALIFKVSGVYVTVETIYDNDWHLITVPNNKDANTGLYLSYSGTETVTISALIVKDTAHAQDEVRFSNIEKETDKLTQTSEQVGEGVGASNFNSNKVYCPNKAITKDGFLSKIGFTAGAACTLTVYVGELDQRYLFIPRSSHSFSCASGANDFDVASLKIAVYAGEHIAFMPSTGGVKYNNGTSGDPLSENSFLYTADGSLNLFQLQVYGAQKIFKINFYAQVTSDVFIQQTLESLKIQAQVSTMGETVGSLSSNMGIVNDAQGNKYRLKVVNGAVVPVPLNFRNALCVGNSFTVHPTTTDTGAAFTTAYWWGHWAMAASSPNVAWTKLLQDTLRVKQNDAVVTPIFGRPYETGVAALTDNDAFVYWESGTRKSLKANLASFSGVDCIVFFLGDNYTGNDWETKYSAMCDQFASWFPSASIYCVGAVVSASVASSIQNVASAKGYPFIDVLSIKTQPLRNREGNFVLGDDNTLHQINYSAVGNHFGDYGQFKLNEKIATAIGVTPVTSSYLVTLNSQLLSLLQYNYLENSIVSIFADDSVTAISVVDGSNNAITATSHSTDYGKIFTFTMPASDVSVSVAS